MTDDLQKFIDESQAVCEAATKGPWRSCVANKPDNTGGIDCGILDLNNKIIAEAFEIVGMGTVCGFDKRPSGDNAAFIAHARTALPLALQHIRELIKERDELKAEVKG